MCRYLVAKILAAAWRLEFAESYEIEIKASGIIFISSRKRAEEVIESQK